MPVLPSHIQSCRGIMQAKEAARRESADRVWAEVAANQRAMDERTAKLRAMWLARRSR
jgi:hypothetical protein